MPFKEEEVKYTHVEIDLEEILEFTSDGASSEGEQNETKESVEVKPRVLSKFELRNQKTKKPFGSQESRGLSQVIKHKSVNVKTEYEILGIGKDMCKPDETSKLIISKAKSNAKSQFWRNFDKGSPLAEKPTFKFSKTVRIKPLDADEQESKSDMKRMDSMFKEKKGSALLRLASR